MTLLKPATGALCAALVFGSLTFARAQGAGETVQGELLHVELRDTPRHIKVRSGNGEVQQTIANRTHVIFDPSEAGFFPNSELSDLKSGMQVQFAYTDGVLDRVRVLSVPANLRPALPGQAPRVDDGSNAKRVGTVDDGRSDGKRVGTINDGRGDAKRLRTATASESGRVVSVDKMRRQVVLNVNGRSERFSVNDANLMDSFRKGDSVQFEAEQRVAGSRRVITRVN